MPKRMKLNFKGGGKGLVIGIALVVLLILIVGGGVAAYLLTRPQKCSDSDFSSSAKCSGGSDSSLSLYKGEATCSSTKCTQSECCKSAPPVVLPPSPTPPPPPPPPPPSEEDSESASGSGSGAGESPPQPAPVDCFGNWTDWHPCTEECGGGTQGRHYIVTTQPSNGGAACPTPLSEERDCNIDACTWGPCDGNSSCSAVDSRWNWDVVQERTICQVPGDGNVHKNHRINEQKDVAMPIADSWCDPGCIGDSRYSFGDKPEICNYCCKNDS